MGKDKSLSLIKGVVQPWECDSLGHFTTRYYMAMFDDASYQLLFEVFGWSGASDNSESRAFVDVRHEIDYLDELQAGDLLEIRGSLVHVGTKSIRVRYDMRKRAGERIAASLEATYVLFDLRKREALALDDALRAQANAALNDQADDSTRH